MSIDRKPTQELRAPAKRDPRPYSEKLKSPQWQRKRLEVLNAAGWRCQECQAADLTLHVHHSFYPVGREPWEIEGDLLLALCQRHHEERQQLEQHIFVGIARRLCALNLRGLRALDAASVPTVASLVRTTSPTDAAAKCPPQPEHQSTPSGQLRLLFERQ